VTDKSKIPYFDATRKRHELEAEMKYEAYREFLGAQMKRIEREEKEDFIKMVIGFGVLIGVPLYIIFCM
jgi:hypothetical protein